MVRDDDAIDEDHEMSITDEDIIRITASEGIPARRVKALELTRQASSFLLSEDFMNKFFRRFTETAFRHDPTSSFSQIFLPGKEVSEKFEDAQQALIPVQRVKQKEKEKEKETEKEKEKETEKRERKRNRKRNKTRGSEASKTNWTEIKKFALKGDTLSMDPKGVAMPVTYDAHDANPKWERLDREVVRDLMKAVCDNGLGSPYFKQLLKGTFNIYDLTPFDLRSLATMILSDSQFILWEAKWRKILNDYRIKYQGGANAGFTVAQLAGDPPLDSAARQASFLPRDVLTDIKDAARKAMVQIPPAGVTESLFTDVKQCPSEPFASFIDRLTQAVDRQVIDEGVKSHMIRCLAFANANPECKRVISAMPGQPTMAEILEACSKAFASLGVPQEIKTDNGPTYIGKVLDKFLKRWGVHHTFGIPHSPTGQAIIERTHQTLKSLLDRQKRGEADATPYMHLNKALYVLNFLNGSFAEPTPPIIRHFSNSTRAKLKENPLVLVRNPETGQIEGPFKLITWGKGYACVSTAVGPKWLAARHVKPYRVQTQAETDPKTGGREVGTQT
ncbi:hypothetical protein DUI87_13484 [Hirundo rustica rustica]|uniref:Uncharacterized protein n=1 Tax=Hirundo rustica rustica TaxID=333673 RepID=A0A3M0K943_HIRRU|nr:hypothetical protein DUI87_13484 [Hirundo rustica rustica]